MDGRLVALQSFLELRFEDAAFYVADMPRDVDVVNQRTVVLQVTLVPGGEVAPRKLARVLLLGKSDDM